MGNEIQKYEAAQSAAMAVAPRSYDDVQRLALAVSKSGVYGCRSADDAFVRIVTGVELGISPMQAMRCIAVVQGKPVLDAALIAGLCMRHHECRSWRTIESTDEKCTIETRHARNGATRLTYTMAQAQRAGLTGKETWKHYPAAMLRARCVSALARMAYPEVVAGIYVHEEMEREGAAQPEPVAEVVPEPEPTDGPAAEFVARISVADDAQALTAIGLDVRKAGLRGADAALVREAYAARQRELRAAKARASQPQAAEPPPEDMGDAYEPPPAVDPETGEVAA
jgi:hypothetical protein